jgi:hypothetical protein
MGKTRDAGAPLDRRHRLTAEVILGIACAEPGA